MGKERMAKKGPLTSYTDAGRNAKEDQLDNAKEDQPDNA